MNDRVISNVEAARMSEYLAKSPLGVKQSNGVWFGTLDGFLVGPGRSESNDAYQDAINMQAYAMSVYINKANRRIL